MVVVRGWQAGKQARGVHCVQISVCHVEESQIVPV